MRISCRGSAFISRLILAAVATLIGLESSYGFGSTSSPLVPVVVSQPVVPAPHVRHPGLFDEAGCALLSSGSRTRRVCPAPPERNDGGGDDILGHGGQWGRFLGFDGPYYATTVTNSGVELLPSTLRVSDDGNWSAVGMVRNDTTSTVDDIVVSAQLEAVNGSVLEKVSSRVPVRMVRPGEPAPFAVASESVRRAIAAVRWVVTYRSLERSTSDLRLVELLPVRFLPAGNRPVTGADRTTVLGGQDMWIGPPRDVVWGMLKSWGARSIRRPSMIALWMDDDGRALSLVRGEVWTADPAASSPPPLAPGGFARFVVAVPSGAASWQDRQRLRLALWETPS